MARSRSDTPSGGDGCGAIEIHPKDRALIARIDAVLAEYEQARREPVPSAA
jgi:hypothetical protein